jgi:hypothetical protein
MRGDEKRTYYRVRAARLVDDGGAKVIELASKALDAIRQRTRTQIRAAAHHQARGFARRVRINDFNALHQ